MLENVPSVPDVLQFGRGGEAAETSLTCGMASCMVLLLAAL